MHDMLVRLYDLPEEAPSAPRGIVIRRAMPYERRPVAGWVSEHFGNGWAGECETSLSRVPPSCFVATSNGFLAGFACYDATCLGFFGPAGVEERHRGTGIGRALLHACLRAMRCDGYAYAVIGGVAGECEAFYSRVAGAVLIEGSDPGIYADRLKQEAARRQHGEPDPSGGDPGFK